MTWTRVWRGLKYFSLTSGGAGSLYYLHINDWDLYNTGPLRIGRAGYASLRIAVDYKWSLRNLEQGSDEYRKTMSEIHTRSALRLREMCCKNRGVYIKVGQHLGALAYLLPIEYVDVMKVLHSQAPESPLEDIKRVIKEDLGKEADDIFTNFEEKPLGTASLAQVYKAHLQDGTPVAVKVQHPKVRDHAAVDMATMELLVNIVAKVFPEFQCLWLAELTKKNLPLELDFTHEAKNCKRMAEMFKNLKFVKVPKVMSQFTTERVLTMEFCEGCQVNDKEFMSKNNIDVNEVSTKLGKLYSEMIFVRGFVHCDPHPGNVLVNMGEDGMDGVEIVLLDHGLYQSLKDDFRITYCNLWKSILEGNIDGIKTHAQRLGAGDLFPLFACILTGRSWNSLSKGINTSKTREVTKEEEDEIRDGVVEYLPQIAEVLNRVPRQVLMLLKTNDLLRGIETSLNTRANASSFIVMSKCCVHALYEHKRRHCTSRLPRLKLYIEENWKLFQIWCYEVYLWFFNIKMFNGQRFQKSLKSKAKKSYDRTKKQVEEKVANSKRKIKVKKDELVSQDNSKFPER